MSNDININITVSGDTMHHRRLHIGFGTPTLKHHPAPPRTQRGLKVIYQLDDDTAVTFPLVAADEWGNPTTVGLGTPTATSSDPTIATATIASNALTITPVSGKLGSCQVVVTATAGTATLTGSIDLTVVAGTAATIGFGTPTTSPVTVPPAPTPTPAPTPAPAPTPGP